MKGVKHKMATDGLKTLIISFLLVGLFMYALISFGTQFQTDMGANQTILNDTDSNLSGTYYDLNESLVGSQSTGESARESFESEEAKAEFGSLTFKSIVGIGKSFTGTMVTFFKIIFSSIKTIFGLSSSFLAVISTLSAIFLVTIIFFAWRAYRAGS